MPEPAQNYIGDRARVRRRSKALKVWAITIALLVLWNLLFTSAPLFGSDLVYRFFSYICHQIPERSLFIFGGPMAVCSRCVGIYVGLLAGVLIYPLWRGVDELEPISKLWLFLALVPVGIDWSLTAFGIWENTHLSRFITGAILGAICATFITPAILEIVRNLSNARART